MRIFIQVKFYMEGKVKVPRLGGHNIFYQEINLKASLNGFIPVTFIIHSSKNIFVVIYEILESR